MNCYKCQKTLNEYYEHLGRNYCPECIKDFWDKCAICNRPMDRWIESSDGKKYCSDECYEKDLPHCYICGKSVRQWLTDQNGHIFCSDACFETILPCCDSCGKRMKEWSYTQNGIKYCDSNCKNNIENVMTWYYLNNLKDNPFKLYQLSKESSNTQNDIISVLILFLRIVNMNDKQILYLINKVCISNSLKVDVSSCVKKSYKISYEELSSVLDNVSSSDMKYYFIHILVIILVCDDKIDEKISTIADVLSLFKTTKFEQRFLFNRIRSLFLSN